MSLPWSEFPDEELRIAGVFNGGVSLAVWMGGATHELNRLIQARQQDEDDGDRRADYRALLELVRTTVVADVLAGTSAGGINGAALAVAQANPRADLAMLRKVWAEQGRFDELLRAPFQGDPTSLLRGDEYFLPQLSRTMVELALTDAPPPGETAAGGVPNIDLMITTTLLEPAEREVPDDLGQATYQQVHAGHFRFSQAHFGPGALPTTARKLGLAARASAGFPMAFEATFIPVNAPADRPDRDLRPDMAGHASWATGPDDGSRFAMDGGVLANTPLRTALDAIRDKTAKNPVRRMMLLVYPHAPLTSTTLTVAQDEAPTVVAGVLDLVAALRSHGGQTFIEELEAHNRAVEGWRGGREDALPGRGELQQLYELAEIAWPRYRSLRERLSASTLAERVKRRSWTYERTRVAALDAQHAVQLPQVLPYVPADPPPALSCVGLTHPTADTATEGPLRDWRWGPVVAVGITDSLEAILRAASGAARGPEQLAPLRDARETVIRARAQIVEARDEVDGIWDGGQAQAMAPDAKYWQSRLVAFRRAMLPPAEAVQPGDIEVLAALAVRAPEVHAQVVALDGSQGRDVARAVWTAVSTLTAPEVAQVVHGLSVGVYATITGLDRWSEVLTAAPLPNEPESLTLRLVMRLLAVDTATWLIASSDSQGTHLPIRSAQLSLGVQHGFARLSTKPADKAAGLQLGHFAGFLKRSWRANDWIWGRLDAARMLCEIVLSPDRLRRLAVAGGEGTTPADLAEQALQSLGSGSIAQLTPGVRAQVLAEIETAMQPSGDLPATLPTLAEYAALPIQRRIILEELPHLRSAILADRFEKQNPRSRGELFLVEHAALLAAVESGADPAVWGDRALAAFDSAGIGREGLEGEAGSDAMIQTAANVAGVAATVLSSDRFGAKALQPLAKTVRGAIQLPYWALRGLTQGSAIARALAQVGIVVGGVLLALGLLGVLGGGSGFATAIGVATVLTVLGYSALRTGTLLHGVLLLAAAGPLGAFLLDAAHAKDDAAADAHDGLVGAVVVLSICAALWVLASLPWPLRSPVDAAKQVWARHADAIVVGLLAGELLGSLVVLVVVESDWTIDGLGDAVGDAVRDAAPSGGVVAAIAMAVVALGSFIAWQRGRGLRTWSPVAGGRRTTRQSLQLPAGVAATWAVVYGAVCLAASGAIAQWGEDGPAWVFSIVWLAVIGVLLVLVVPMWLTGRFRRRLDRELVSMSPVPTSELTFLAELGKRDRLFVYLVRPASEVEQAMDPGPLRLTRRGRRVHSRALQNAGIRPMWDRA